MSTPPAVGSVASPAAPHAARPAADQGRAAGHGPGAVSASVVVGRAPRRGFPWKPVGWTALVLAAVALFVFVLAFTRPSGSTLAYSSENASDEGARALAQVLEDNGVSVHELRTVGDAFSEVGPGETLLVTPHPSYYEPGQIEALAQIESDVVLLAPEKDLLRAVTDGQVEAWNSKPAAQGGPRCDAPAAQAAQDIDLEAGLDVVGQGADACWPTAQADGYAYVRVRVDGRWVHVIHDPSLVRNDTVLDGGNAALALGTLGAHERLTWLVPDLLDTTMLDGPSGDGQGADGDDQGGEPSEPTDPRGGPEGTGLSDLLPAGMVPVAWIGLITAVFLAIWRGRRLGPLVTEPLPVLVRSAETMRGRGRLYRAVRARGHAAAGLRASAAHRMAQRLGLARSSDATTVTDAVAAATDRPTTQVAHLLYGPPPADDGELTELARSLDTLESEVHRS